MSVEEAVREFINEEWGIYGAETQVTKLVVRLTALIREQVEIALERSREGYEVSPAEYRALRERIAALEAALEKADALLDIAGEEHDRDVLVEDECAVCLATKEYEAARAKVKP